MKKLNMNTLANTKRIAACALWTTLTLSITARAADWPQWGGEPSRNMASNETGLPDDFEPGELIGRSGDVDMTTTKNVKWIAPLGSQAYGNATVSDGRVLVGTNNDAPRDPKYKGDRGVVYCLDEKTGKLVWQLAVPKLGAGKVSDWEFLGVCSSPAVADGRVYVVTNLCEVICLDLDGLTDGNDGVQDELTYYRLPANTKLGEHDADVVWRFDMRRELGIFPHNITSSSVLVVDGDVYATTSNGVDWSHLDVPNRQAPCLVKLDAKTGELLAEEASGVSTRLMHCNWSSPSAGKINGQTMIFFGAGDGFMYGFDPKPVMDEEGYPIFNEIWRCDGVPMNYRFDSDSRPIKYATAPGPSEFIATPVFYKSKVYAAIGQDPEHGEGVGSLTCFDPMRLGDATTTGGIIWRDTEIHRAISTCSIADDLLYVADYSGVIHCLDALTGQRYWTHDTQGHVWGSTMVVDGKVYVGNEDGYLTILKTGKTKQMIREIEFPAPIYATPTVANGVLYIATQSHFYAFQAESQN